RSIRCTSLPPAGATDGAVAQRHVPLVQRQPGPGKPAQLRACLANASQGKLVAQGAQGNRLLFRSALRKITHPFVSTQQPTSVYACSAQSASWSKRSWTALNNATTPTTSSRAMMETIRAYSTEVTPRSRHRLARILDLNYRVRTRPP